MTLRAKEPSVVELTVAEHVQIDRLVRTPHGHLAERAGDLLAPGATTMNLDPGLYFFKTLSAAHLKVVHGGVETYAASNSGKDPWPPPPPFVVPSALGDQPAGRAPSFTIEGPGAAECMPSTHE